MLCRDNDYLVLLVNEMNKLCGHDDVLIVLTNEVNRVGNQKKFAEKYGFSASYINDVLNGRRAISDRLASVVGFKRNIVFQADDGK